jgi:hypothetical protein
MRFGLIEGVFNRTPTPRQQCHDQGSQHFDCGWRIGGPNSRDSLQRYSHLRDLRRTTERILQNAHSISPAPIATTMPALFIMTRRVLSLLIILQTLISNHIKITLTATVPQAKDIYALQDIRPFATKILARFRNSLPTLGVHLKLHRSSRNSHIPSVLI